MSTDIVKVTMNAPLQYSEHLMNLPESDVRMIADSFPSDDLSGEQRLRKAGTMLAQTKLYIDNSKTKDKLLACVAQSIAESILTLASLDLPLTQSLGYAALIPYGNVCTVSLMYQGLGELMMRTGTIGSIQTGVVYKGDSFKYELGSDPWLKYSRGDELATDANLTHSWCIAHNLHGPKSIEVMERSELDKVRKASKMPQGPAWKGWFSQMTRKAPMRRMAKYMQTAVGGMAQSTLSMGLDLENSQYDIGRMDHYKQIRQDNSDELKARAAASLAPPEALPAPTEIPPPTVDEDNALATIVGEMREGVESTLMDAEFILQVTFSLFEKNEITSKAEFVAVWNAIVNEKAFDLATGDRIPDMGEQA